MGSSQESWIRLIIITIVVGCVIIGFIANAVQMHSVAPKESDRSSPSIVVSRSSPGIEVSRGKTNQRSPITAERKLEKRFVELLPDSEVLVSAWFKQEGLRVLPQTVGGDEGDLKKVGPIIVSRVTGMRTVTWPSHRFANKNSGASLSHLTTSDSDLVKKGTVRFEQGAIRIDAANFPADSKWHLFCLATEEPLGTSEEEREVFCVQRSGDKEVQGSATSPVEMLVRGYIAEAWVTALGTGWNENQLRSFVFMASEQTELLAGEALTHLTGSLRDKRYAFLLRDIDASVPRLDARKQSLLQCLLIAP